MSLSLNAIVNRENGIKSLTKAGLARHAWCMSITMIDLRSIHGQAQPRWRAGEALRAFRFAHFAPFINGRPPRS
jgi:hypothetical protein